MDFTDFLLVALAFFLAAGVWGLLTRIKWMLGFPPLILDHQQAHIAAKGATHKLIEHFKAIGRIPSDQDAHDMDEFISYMYGYAREVIVMYAKQLESPTFDMTPDPAPIRERRAAHGEAG